MRSHNLSRAVLRSAIITRNATSSTSRAVPRLLHTTVAPNATASLRAFSSSSVSLKKKNKKNAFAAVEDDLPAEQQDADEFAIEDDDDLFGGISDTTNTTSTSTSSSSGNSAMSRVDFARHLESYRSNLEWESIDRGQPPSLSRWRYLAGHASTQSELTEVLELAKLYRDRVGSLGVESGKRFASRAAAMGLPEVALNAFLDRYAYGLEYDVESLYYVQSALMRKLKRGNREEILESAEMKGVPVQGEDLLGVVPPAEGAAEGEREAEADGGKAEAIEAKHKLDMPLARAQLSIIDRMSLLASLSSSSPTTPLDPILLSYIPHAYIETFQLVSDPTAFTNPLLTNVFNRTDALISLLTLNAQRSLSSPSSLVGDAGVLANKRSTHLGKNLVSTLSYVAVRGGSKFTDPVKGKQLDPVRTLYRFMDKVGPQKSNDLVRKVEPLFQSSATA